MHNRSPGPQIKYGNGGIVVISPDTNVPPHSKVTKTLEPKLSKQNQAVAASNSSRTQIPASAAKSTAKDNMSNNVTKTGRETYDKTIGKAARRPVSVPEVKAVNGGGVLARLFKPASMPNKNELRKVNAPEAHHN
jgi:hypothetical protein